MAGKSQERRTMNLPIETHALISKLAKSQGRDMIEIVRRAVALYAKQGKKS